MNWWIERLEEHKDSRAIIDVLSGREDSYSNILSMSKLLTCWQTGRRVEHLSPRLTAMTLAQMLCYYIEGDKVIVISNNHQPDISANPLLNKVKRGLVIVTSGSTGKPKRILHDLDKLVDAHKSSKKALRTIAFLKFDHMGGFNTVLYTLSAGGTLIVPPSLGVVDVCRSIEKYKAELLPTTPSFINLLLAAGAHETYDLSSLKIISFGTEPMPDSLLERIKSAFPNVILKQTYGMSEIGVGDCAEGWNGLLGGA